jgi:O-antigen ligase
LLFGGASAAGAIANAALQLTALVLIVASVWSADTRPIPRDAAALAWVLLLFIVLVIVQIVPLPAKLWMSLPGREAVASGFELMGVSSPSLPISLMWERSAASLLWLLPPAAIFLLTVTLGNKWRTRLGWVVLVAAIISIALSAFQLLGGEQSSLRFYEITNPNRAVGFFASANHLPALILCAVPFTGILAARAFKSRSGHKNGGGLALSGAFAAFLLAGILVSGSIAGYALLLPTALATFLIYRITVFGSLSKAWVAVVGVLLLLIIGLVSTGPVNDQLASSKFSEHPTSRSTIWKNTSKAVGDFFPAGSGLGTYSAVYRTYDNPDRASNVFVNHAHNDYLEVALELGAPGVLLVLAFVIWWVRRTAGAWQHNFKGAALARAGSIMVGVLLAHSTVDYPVRTSALAAVLALGCGFLVPIPSRKELAHSATLGNEAGLRHLEAA